MRFLSLNLVQQLVVKDAFCSGLAWVRVLSPQSGQNSTLGIGGNKAELCPDYGKRHLPKQDYKKRRRF